MFKKFDHLFSSAKNSPSRHSTKFLLPPPKVYPPTKNNFHVINQKASFLAAVIAPPLFSFYLRTLRIHSSYQFYLINAQYIQIVVFSFEKGLSGQKHSS